MSCSRTQRSDAGEEFQRVKYDAIIKCEGIIKAILENPKSDQNTCTLFRKYIRFQTPRVYF